MPATVRSGTLLGLRFTSVEVEVDIQNGLPRFVIVGLPDTSLQEARDRVTSAMKNSGYGFPRTHVVANLAPADVRKIGPGFDVPLAVGILAALGEIPSGSLEGVLLFGELALDGGLRSVSGMLPLLLGARQAGAKRVIIPSGNGEEARLCPDLEIFLATTLQEVVGFLRKETTLEKVLTDTCASEQTHVATRGGESTDTEVDFMHIAGQHHAKRALEIAAAGGHNLLFLGPPGSGKTLLARALPGILPPLSKEELLEVSMIQSLGRGGAGLVSARPFRAPHHTLSATAMIGGGAYPRPGEVTLAHRGVLFLDEFPEFRREAIEHLRQPLEEGFVQLSRVSGTVRYPARFQLIAAMNPCPCGFLGDGSTRCECSSSRRLLYAKKISGPIQDRIDLHVTVPRVPTAALLASAMSESSNEVRKRVIEARKRQSERYQELAVHSNQELTHLQVRVFCELDTETRGMFEKAVERMQLSARGANRVLKVARTIADLAGNKNIRATDVLEALQFRR